MLLIDGVQVPVIPLFEVVGSAAKVPPAQMADTCVKVGVIFELTVMVILAVLPHCPTFGVKV